MKYIEKTFSWEMEVHNTLLRMPIRYPGTWVSEDGKILRAYRTVSRWLKTNPSNDRYARVWVTDLESKTEKRRCISVHILVALAWIGPKPFSAAQVNHKVETLPLNNHATNLYWGTKRDNSFDAIKNGLQVYDERREIPRGSKQHKSVLTEDKVRAIKQLLHIGHSVDEIRKLYGVGYNCIYAIKRGWGWKHV